MILFFSSRTANGVSAPAHWPGGAGMFYVHGLFEGGTVSLEYSVDGGASWAGAGPDLTFTVAGAGRFRLGNCRLRAALTGASTADVTAAVAALEARGPSRGLPARCRPGSAMPA